MRKIWPSEGNCIMPNDQFRKVNFTLRKFRKEIFFMVRNFAISQCEFHIAKISQGELTHDAKIWHFASWVIHLAKISQGAFYLAKFPLFLHARTTDFPDIFSLIFSRVNSFCNLVFSRHKALSCNFAIYRGAQRLQKILDDWGIDPLYINLEIYKALFFSLLLFFPISIFIVAKQPLRAFPQRMIG